MPAVSEKQRRFFGAELSRAERGKPRKTKMRIQQLKEFAKSLKKGK